MGTVAFISQVTLGIVVMENDELKFNFERNFSTRGQRLLKL